MKKTLGLLITAMVMASIIPVAQANVYVPEFSDVSFDNPQHEAIMYLREKGLIGGYADGTFKPDQTINRAETMKMILGITAYNGWVFAPKAVLSGAAAFGTDKFSDIDAGAWYLTYLEDAYNQALVTGYPDKTFRPGDPINTVEALKILLHRTYFWSHEFGFEDLENKIPYADIDQKAWYLVYVFVGMNNNILLVEDNKIYPDRDLTRGDLAEMIYRTLVTDENGWDKYMDISVKTVFQTGSDALTEAKLIIDGKEAGDLFTGNYNFPRIFRVVGSKVYLNYSPTVHGGSYSVYGAGPVQGSAIYDLETDKLTWISLGADNTAVIEDISKDGGLLLVRDYLSDDQRLVLMDSSTLAVKATVYTWINDWNENVMEVGDATISPDGKKIAWSETHFMKTPDTSDDGEMFPYIYRDNLVKTYDIAANRVETVSTRDEGVLRITGWDADGVVTEEAAVL